MTAEPLALDPARPTAAEVKRLAISLADDALRQLQFADHGSREEAVHEARKRFKELRALLRLVETTPLRRRSRPARQLVRDAGQSLSGVRDADVLAETFEKLRMRFAADIEPSRALQDALVNSAGEEWLDTRNAVQLVGRVRNDIALWRFEITFEEIRDAFTAGYRAARAAMTEAVTSRTVVAFHEWRKREKDHWYHTRMLEEVLPPIREREPSLHRLSRILGDHHDLVLVTEAAAAKATADYAAAAVNLAVHARQRMREIEREAEILGSEVFGLTARQFVADVAAIRQVVATIDV